MNRQDTISFEEAFKELEQTVHKLEEGELNLEETIALFERGIELARFCNEQLDQAELKVRQLLPTGLESTEILFD